MLFLLSAFAQIATAAILMTVALVLIIIALRRRALRPAREEEDVAEPEARAAPVSEGTVILNQIDAIERCGGSEEDFHVLITVSLTEYPKLLAAARAALDREDAVTLQRTAHTIKGSALIFAAEPARLAAERVEMLATEKQLRSPDMRDAFEQMTQRTRQLLATLASLLPDPGSPPS